MKLYIILFFFCTHKVSFCEGNEKHVLLPPTVPSGFVAPFEFSMQSAAKT